MDTGPYDLQKIQNVESAAMCYKHCQDHLACKAWTWAPRENANHKMCRLKSESGYRPKANLISGPSLCRKNDTY